MRFSRCASVHVTGRDKGDLARYVVPALLPESPVPPGEITATGAGGSGNNFIFAFRASNSSSDWNSGVILLRRYDHDGFLPSGLFQRLIGKALEWSQADVPPFLPTTSSTRDRAELYIGDQQFTITERSDINVIQVEVEKNPSAVHERLRFMLT